jgi:hypothetical protein
VVQLLCLCFSSSIHIRKAIARYFNEKGKTGAKHPLVSDAVVSMIFIDHSHPKSDTSLLVPKTEKNAKHTLVSGAIVVSMFFIVHSHQKSDSSIHLPKTQ